MNPTTTPVAIDTAIAVVAADPATLPATDVRTGNDADLIPLLRTQIDALDAGIANLIAERARLSHRIQAARISAGGVRIELGRERRILEGYRGTLGEGGITLGSAILRLCRGPL